MGKTAVDLSRPPLARGEKPGLSQSGAHDFATTPRSSQLLKTECRS